MKKMKVLVVDDSLTLRRAISSIIKKIGFREVVEAENGLVALEKMRDCSFDLILTDWNMPMMDGLTFVKLVRSTKAYKHIPILMVTSESAKSEVMSAILLGVTDFIVKPVSPEILMEKILLIISGMGKLPVEK